VAPTDYSTYIRKTSEANLQVTGPLPERLQPQFPHAVRACGVSACSELPLSPGGGRLLGQRRTRCSVPTSWRASRRS
jgi:hypothetical protein